LAAHLSEFIGKFLLVQVKRRRLQTMSLTLISSIVGLKSCRHEMEIF